MTVVVAVRRGNVVAMASDSLRSGAVVSSDAGPKIVRVGDALLGWSGPWSPDTMRFVLSEGVRRAVKKDGHPGLVESVCTVWRTLSGKAHHGQKDDRGTFCIEGGLLLASHGEFSEIDSLFQRWQHAGGYHAIGSGAPVAMGAMHPAAAGAWLLDEDGTPQEQGAADVALAAVKAAIAHAPGCGGRVHVETVEGS